MSISRRQFPGSGAALATAPNNPGWYLRSQAVCVRNDSIT